MKIVIVDYGMGNIHSLKSALDNVSKLSDVSVSNEHNHISNADLIFLPGVGNFKTAMDKLKTLGLTNLLKELVIQEKKPIMGICLGMQLLFRCSSEGGTSPGLGFLDAEVTKLSDGKEKIPHIGFNSVCPSKNSLMFKNIGHMDYYFVHTYCVSKFEQKGVQVSYCDYNDNFVAAVEFKNIWGTQFHPEKSQGSGLKILSNFVNTCGA